MTPAMLSGPAASVMRSVSGSSSRTTWSRVSRRSPGAARRTMIRPSWTAAEGVDRLAELDHDVVGGVDDVTDRPLTRRE
jgi:hypothetical protein